MINYTRKKPAAKSASATLDALIVDFGKALPQLKERRQQLLSEIMKIDQAINAAQRVMHAFDVEPDATQTRIVELPMPRPSPLAPSPTPSGRAPRRQVFSQVEQILSDGKKYGATELRKELKQQFGIDYSFASVYRALTRGREEGKYENRGGEWKLKPK